MALFALPVTSSTTSRQSAETRSSRYKLTLPSRKRKRGSESPPESENENSHSDDDDLPPPSTNPLSLAPTEVLQYQLAGLELNRPLPRAKDFPHRGLPARRVSTKTKKDRKGKGRAIESSDDEEEEEPKNDDEDEINRTNPPHGSRLRMQHFRVLVAILHKCLLEGDIKRALRAWTMLLRLQFGGVMLDIRTTGYWAIGAELLARSEESTEPVLNKDEEEPRRAKSKSTLGGEREWGTKAGRSKAVNYLGSMVVEFPVTRQNLQRAISAVDFWPSMLAIELYGIQYEHREALNKITLSTELVESGEESDGSDEDNDFTHMSDDSYTASERKAAQRKNKKDVKIWTRKEEVRKNTLAAAESVVARVDELLSDPSYTGNITISEIRAHMALYIGDLGVPERYPELENEKEDEQNSSQRLANRTDTQQRILYRQRINEYEAGTRNRKMEIARATKIVKDLLKRGGTVNGFKDLDLGKEPVDK